jgi:hypothetical protein
LAKTLHAHREFTLTPCGQLIEYQKKMLSILSCQVGWQLQACPGTPCDRRIGSYGPLMTIIGAETTLTDEVGSAERLGWVSKLPAPSRMASILKR